MKDHKREIAVLFVTLFLVMVGFGIIIPILPFFVTDLGGSPTMLGLFMASYSLMQFIFAPLWGRLSDRIGRRPVILLGLGGYGITFILFGFSSQLWMLFAVRILSGMISSATLPTAMAYIADITEGEERSKGMGLMGAAMGMGMIFGPAIGGTLGHHGFALPFFVAGGIALFNLPFAFFLLQESLEDKHAIKHAVPPKFTLAMIKHPLFILFAMGFVLNFAMAMFEGTFALFAADRAGFGPREMGILFAVLGVIGVIVQGGLIGRLVKKFGDHKLVIAGLCIAAAGMALILAGDNMLLLIITTAIFNVGASLIGPSSSTLVTQNATDGQGQALGLMQSANSLGRIAGPIVGGLLYDISISGPYTVGAIILSLFVLLASKKIGAFNAAVDES